MAASADTTQEIPMDVHEVPVPAELLKQVAALVSVIHERNAIEAHRDEKIAALLSNRIVQAIVMVIVVRGLFGADILTVVDWINAAKDVI